MKSAKHVTPIHIGKWIIFYGARDENLAFDFSSYHSNIANTMSLKVAQPEP